MKKNKAFNMVVRRASVLEDALRRLTRATFEPARCISVSKRDPKFYASYVISQFISISAHSFTQSIAMNTAGN